MNQQHIEKYLQDCKKILKQVQDKVKILTSKQEELSKREQNILTIKNNTTQILKILKESQKQTIRKNIQSLNKIIEIKHQETIFSVIELNDLKIATGDYNGYIKLFSIDYDNKQWIKIKEHKGHNGGISSFCELSQNRLISSSWDKTIKVWKINNNTITLIKTLKGHINTVYKVIPLSDNIIASGSDDKTIKIWDVNTYEEIHRLIEDFSVYSLLKLNNKEELASSGYDMNNSVSFWNIKTFTKEHSVACCNCDSFNGLIMLSNRYIAVSGGDSATIDIIDTEHYQRIKQIECKDFIVINDFPSSIYLLNNGTFIYSHNGSFCQISSTTYEVLFKFKMEDEFNGNAIISSANDKYIIAVNQKEGISIFKIDFI